MQQEQTWSSVSGLEVELLLCLQRGASLALLTLSTAQDLRLSAAFCRLEDLTSLMILVSCMNTA